MKNKIRQGLLDCWQILTEVPGWPDAPARLRLRRLSPAALPVLAMIFLVLWNQLWVQRGIEAERASFAPLVALEQEVAELQLAGSEAAAAETAQHAAEAGNKLLSTPKMLPTTLDELSQAARTQGWEATFQALPAPVAPSAAESPLFFVNARGKLSPMAGNPKPFHSLLAVLEQFSPPNRSIDLTRLAIRADEQGRQTAEIHIRVGCRTTE